MKNDFKLIHNREGKSYEFHIDGLIAKIDYIVKNGNIVYITHTEVPEELQGKSVGTQLVLKVLEDIDSNNMKVVPLCPFVASYMARHPQWKKLLMDGINVG